MANIFKEILNCHKRGEVVAVGFIADQVPIWNSIHYWTDFLNHDTPVFTGAERIARHQNMAVFYIHVERVKRGYYTAEFRPITNEPKLAPADQITEQYMRMLEDTITAHPQYWLWTHNRWKRTREQYAEVLGHIRKN